MKLSARDAAAFIERPDPKMAGALIYGEDGDIVASRRDALARLLAGDGTEAAMSIERIDGSAARRSSALIEDSVRDTGFFGGRRIIVVDGATDGALEALSRGVSAAADSGGFIIASAGILPSRSKIRKFFEDAKNAVAAPCYSNPPDRREIEDRLHKAGVAQIGDEALSALDILARRIGAGAFADLVRQISLYALDADEPLTAADIAACAPALFDEDIDAVVDAVLDRKVAEIGPALTRLAGQGQAAVGICIGVARAFRSLLNASVLAEASGIDASLRAMRPPLFGPRRDAMARRLKSWRSRDLEAALKILSETDAALRGGVDGPAYALLGRAFIRIALIR